MRPDACGICLLKQTASGAQSVTSPSKTEGFREFEADLSALFMQINMIDTGRSNFTNLKAIGSYSGNVAYCIEPGISLKVGQTMNKYDENYFNNLAANKDGEFVTDTTLMKGYWYDFIFNFFKDSLAGVTFDVYAKEDIVSADGLDTVYHKAGDKVATIVTNDKGIARIDDLPLGKYYLVETKTIDGFVLDDTPIEADLSYIDQNTKVVFAGMDVTNERQKVQITVTKTDSETKEALEGAVFGLFAKEDIVNKDGKVIVKADTQIERTVTGKDGKVLDTLTTDKNGHAESKELPICTYNEDGSFKEDIHYTVVETKAADGYILDETAHDVTLRYDDNAPDVVVTTLKLINVPTEPKLPQTGDNANPLLYLGIGALALITGVGVGLRGRKKKNKQ